eukprot:5824216-Amphidinium_carterae.1
MLDRCTLAPVAHLMMPTHGKVRGLGRGVMQTTPRIGKTRSMLLRCCNFFAASRCACERYSGKKRYSHLSVALLRGYVRAPLDDRAMHGVVKEHPKQ